ncbi:unnamed protein product [Rhizoctonia solani]|nr:unnamed protein product [Rhizoctonia solani]
MHESKPGLGSSFNSLQQSPCLVASYLGSVCRADNTWRVPQLSGGSIYYVSGSSTKCMLMHFCCVEPFGSMLSVPRLGFKPMDGVRKRLYDCRYIAARNLPSCNSIWCCCTGLGIL